MGEASVVAVDEIIGLGLGGRVACVGLILGGSDIDGETIGVS